MNGPEKWGRSSPSNYDVWVENRDGHYENIDYNTIFESARTKNERGFPVGVWIENNILAVFIVSHLLAATIIGFGFFRYKSLMSDQHKIANLIEELEIVLSLTHDSNIAHEKQEFRDLDALSSDELVDFIDSDEWSGRQRNPTRASDQNFGELAEILNSVKLHLVKRRTYH